jgi:hypothetical protein
LYFLGLFRSGRKNWLLHARKRRVLAGRLGAGLREQNRWRVVFTLLMRREEEALVSDRDDREEIKQADAGGVSTENLFGGHGAGAPFLAGFTASVLQPDNFNGAVALPLTGVPSVLATITGDRALGLSKGARVMLAVTVGWQAVVNGTGVSKLDLVLRIFRNTPVDGPQIMSAVESAEARYDNFRITSLAAVDLDPVHEGTALVSYFLTGELPLAGSSATVTGPIAFMAVRT